MTRAALLPFALALVCVGCASEQERARRCAIECRLGHGFGELITIEAEFVPASHGKGTPVSSLRVLRIEGAAAPEGLEIDLAFRRTLPDWNHEKDEGGMQAGVVYRLRGYESGEHTGWVEAPVDEFGPPQSRFFHFHPWFVVWSVEPVAPSPRAGE
jgi:hypothetical protein